ncbi:hypothetical protein B0J13DRAFT_597374 [Dactylonectria estremocensis]|uniref:Knr4/Smi1-like domain-containing protein n=1 Tax=Dactylonectria estremocensis TaxID=1079267 RepID=A0A9P9IX55_9HYPO|nr:hypothetical protein B0J13DRAFT_597374 [Dactylonectria estremocensis]
MRSLRRSGFKGQLRIPPPFVEDAADVDFSLVRVFRLDEADIAQLRPKFDANAVLTDRCLPDEFAVLGQIGTAKTLISLLLSEHSSDWQPHQIRFPAFASAEANQWLGRIPQENRTEEKLDNVGAQMPPDLREESDTAQDDLSRLERLPKHPENCDNTTGGAAMQRSSALADALATAIRSDSEHTSSIEEIEADTRVQKVLGHASKRMHTNRAIQYLAERRANWPLLSAEALARKVPVDMDKLDALTKKPSRRFLNILKMDLDRNTKANGVSFYAKICKEVPESLFVQPPATDERISALERKVDATLPNDYKEFLKISNGGGGTWNGYFLDPPFSGVNDIDWAEIYVDDIPNELHDTPTGNMDLELPDGREWPSYEKPLKLGSKDILDALEAYKEAMTSLDTPDAVKQQTRKLIASRYSSWESGEGAACARKSAMGVWEGEGERDAGSFAYSCIADDP